MLIRLLLEGPDAVLPADREGDVGAMPPFPHLSDGEIARIVTYVRRTFGHNAKPGVTLEQVIKVVVLFGIELKLPVSLHLYIAVFEDERMGGR